ncbi:MAG: hypothetical protein ETSY1_35460 [Candidatus Entotheonella factor]|uniref:Uncharacterized protein n=1 Tax=Entotheonella factor TaxID=1429438 RepID=W4L9G7_ENTF1|nr:hypothetical protein [Candidatus Entotheonella palauensis]ETW94305.1 MAG: hypothetical protein ETSY1_35460 [Candidatus Entotheonella factor]
MRWRQYRRGDPVIFRVTKSSGRPGPRARNIHPAPHGEFYSYAVDKFWTVVEELGNDMLLLQTRRGKMHRIHARHPQLRHATWWERMRHRARFPQPTFADASQAKLIH